SFDLPAELVELGFVIGRFHLFRRGTGGYDARGAEVLDHGVLHAELFLQGRNLPMESVGRAVRFDWRGVGSAYPRELLFALRQELAQAGVLQMECLQLRLTLVASGVVQLL